MSNEPSPKLAPPAPPEPRRGYTTTEFWLSALAVLLGLLVGSGIIETGSSVAEVVGLATAALASLGYTYSRALVKR